MLQETPVRKNNHDFKTIANNLRLLVGSSQEGDVIKKAKNGGFREINNNGQGYSSQLANYDQFQNISIDSRENNRAMNQTMTEFSPRLPKDSQKDHSRREGSIYKSRETQNSNGNNMGHNISLGKFLSDKRSKPNLRESIEHGG